MHAKIYTNGVWKDAETPKGYSGSSFVDTDGKVNVGSGFVEGWSARWKTYYGFTQTGDNASTIVQNDKLTNGVTAYSYDERIGIHNGCCAGIMLDRKSKITSVKFYLIAYHGETYSIDNILKYTVDGTTWITAETFTMNYPYNSGVQTHTYNFNGTSMKGFKVLNDKSPTGSNRQLSEGIMEIEFS